MDPAKLRIALAIGGALVGSAGIITLSVASVLMLDAYVSLVWAVTITGASFVLLGLLCIFMGLKMLKPAEKELDQFEDATAEALADLPFDTIKAIVEKRPLAATSIAAMVGYSVANNPSAAGKTLQRTLLGII